jgi:hypothetical protein
MKTTVKASNLPYELPVANPQTARYVIIEGIERRNRFFTMNNPETDQTRIWDGSVAYVVLGYADRMADAQMYLYGEVSTERED